MRNIKQNNVEGRKEAKDRRSKRQMFEETVSEALVSNGTRTRREKTAHRQQVCFINNCIVFKVQEFMYKNTVVLASAPQRKREKKKGTNSGEESEKSKIQKVTEQIYIKENVRVC